MRNKPCLTSADVQKMMAACKAEAAKNKWNVSIAIVDDAGLLLSLERLDGAGGITAVVAEGKACTSAVTGRPTKFWEDRIKDRPVFLKFPDSLPIQGGVPLMYQGQCVGAIGVSGIDQCREDDDADDRRGRRHLHPLKEVGPLDRQERPDVRLAECVGELGCEESQHQVIPHRAHRFAHALDDVSMVIHRAGHKAIHDAGDQEEQENQRHDHLHEGRSSSRELTVLRSQWR